MTMITPSYLGETIEYSSLHACRSTLEDPTGTLVTVRHGGWTALRDDHPARHGLKGAAFSRMIGLWWGELLTSLREHAARSDG